MNIQEEFNEGILTVKPEGNLDTLSSPKLEAFLKPRCEEVRGIILDLEKVGYISSAGIRVIVQTHKKMKDKDGLLIRNACEKVMEVLELTGYVHVLAFG